MSTLKYDNLTLTQVGGLSHGIDGNDEYFAVKATDYAPITTEQIDQLFWEKWRYETQQEAGGYFCKRYSFFIDKLNDWQAVLCIHHEYDV
jgi:hypothetical protein